MVDTAHGHERGQYITHEAYPREAILIHLFECFGARTIESKREDAKKLKPLVHILLAKKRCLVLSVQKPQPPFGRYASVYRICRTLGLLCHCYQSRSFLSLQKHVPRVF